MNFHDCMAMFSQMESKVFHYIQRIVKDKRDTEEIIQDVKMKIYLNCSDLRKGTFGRWVFIVAHNISINYLERKFLNCISIDELEDEKMGYRESSNLEMEIEQKEYWEKLHIHVRQLSAIYRIPIEYHYFGEYSYCEMAEILDMPINTIRSRIWRGVRKLREKIGEEEP